MQTEINCPLPEKTLECRCLELRPFALRPPLLRHQRESHTEHQVALRQKALRVPLLAVECLFRKFHALLNIPEVLQTYLRGYYEKKNYNNAYPTYILNAM